ncbi:hypothetical protein TNCV_1601571 [Trichonephila clavipes]|nr:hypothetical protein TNCV_1601571 [Trichonephila clavipes]
MQGQCFRQTLRRRSVISVSDENIEKVSITFFDSQDIIREEFLPEETTMTVVREYYTTHQAMPSELPADRWEVVDGLQFVGQA